MITPKISSYKLHSQNPWLLELKSRSDLTSLYSLLRIKEKRQTLEAPSVAHITPSPQIQSNPENEESKNVIPEGLYSLFILRESGCPFFYRIYNEADNHPDPAILGGFFIALSLFAKEVTDGYIETVTTEPCRYTFHQLNRGLLVICSAKNFNQITLEIIIKRISQLFVTKYRDRLLHPQPAAIVAPNLSKHIDRIFRETITHISKHNVEVVS